MTLVGLLLGLINIALVIVILIMIGAIAMWLAGLIGFPIPYMVQRLFMAVIALVALYMIVALLFGIPTIHLIRP